jgi:hypothetical protein
VRLPVQVWRSYFWRSPYDDAHARDLRRAQSNWQGEFHVWLDPKAKEVTRWTRVVDGTELSECVVPSETINCFDIMHVDGQGRVYPSIPLPEVWQGSVSGAYLRWMEESPNIFNIDSECVNMLMPVIQDGKVTISEDRLKRIPGSLTSSSTVNDNGTFSLSWRNPKNAKMLALNQEIAESQGPTHYERQIIKGKEMLVVVSDKNPSIRAFSYDFGWDKPYSYMLGEGGGAELASHQGKLKRCIQELQEGQHYRVLREVETWVSVFTSPGRTSLWHAWFAPMAANNTEEVLSAVETQFNLQANTMNELYQLDDFHQIMSRSVGVMVAYDWLGYMWWDFYQDLREKVSIRCCEACGRVIRGGHSDRRFCTRGENPKCFQKRNTTNQRKKRAHNS